MVKTRKFRALVADRATRDPEFRIGLVSEAFRMLLSGDLAAATIVLRAYLSSRKA